MSLKNSGAIHGIVPLGSTSSVDPSPKNLQMLPHRLLKAENLPEIAYFDDPLSTYEDVFALEISVVRLERTVNQEVHRTRYLQANF